MEQDEEYKRVVNILKELEHASLNGGHLHVNRSKVIQSVEREFDNCIKVLLARKEALLNEIESLFQAEVNKSIKECQELLEIGSVVYAENKAEAAGIWKTAPAFLDVNIISVNFSNILSENISAHGAVELASGPLAGNVACYFPLNISGPISTLAGSTQGNANGSSNVAQFNTPVFGCFNPIDSCYYLSDCGNHSIRKVDGQGEVTTFAATKGDDQLSYPLGIAHYRKQDCFFVCSQNQHTIKKISSTGTITTFAGSGNQGFADGIGANASFNYPCGIAIDQQTGTLFISDFSNHAIRKITPEGEVSTLAGTGKVGSSDGIGKSGAFYGPSGVCFDEKEQTLTICDFNNYKLRQLDLKNGEVTTICAFNSPYGISITSRNSFIVSSRNSHKLMLVTKKGGNYEAKALAGSGIQGYEDGEPLASKFNYPCGVSVDPQTNKCFVVEYSNNRIRTFNIK